jgi:hypothetical protein
MPKGNVEINKSLAKDIEYGNVIQELPEIEFEGKMYSLFTPISPISCKICGNSLNSNECYDRYIISSYGIIRCPVNYWVCSNPKCKKHHHDTLIGVTGSANYSDEYNEKMKNVRYEGRCTLWNSRITGEIFTEGLTDISGRAPCPTTLWKYEQIRGRISAQEMKSQEINFNGVLYIDGYWVKTGWRKYIEAQLGKKLTNREWKRLRYKVIYVVATEDKVVLDFQITNNMPSYLELVPLLNRIKSRIPEGEISKIVSDEDNAIIGAVTHVFPNVSHSFCVFHQLQNVTQKYLDEFASLENIPLHEVELYKLANDLILDKSVIESTQHYQMIMKMAKEIDLSKASEKVVSYIEKIYFNNRKLLEKGFTPETNNVMEQLFSLIDDVINQARSFKINNGLANFCYNLFTSLNNRRFNTGPWRGYSPISRAKIKYG